MEGKKIDIEMGDMIGKAYFSIATWFNNDYGSERERQEALKQVSAEVIQSALEDVFMQLKGVKGTETKVVKQDVERGKQSESTYKPKTMFEPADDPITRAIKKGE